MTERDGEPAFVNAGAGWEAHKTGDSLPKGPFLSKDAAGVVTIWDGDDDDQETGTDDDKTRE